MAILMLGQLWGPLFMEHHKIMVASMSLPSWRLLPGKDPNASRTKDPGLGFRGLHWGDVGLM